MAITDSIAAENCRGIGQDGRQILASGVTYIRRFGLAPFIKKV